jgi:hypothetical protein
MAAVGGVVGLGVYGLYKFIEGADAAGNFSRNMQALAQITRKYEEKRRWAALEVDWAALEVNAQLESLKCQMRTGTNPTNEIDSELQALKAQMQQGKNLSQLPAS